MYSTAKDIPPIYKSPGTPMGHRHKFLSNT